MLDILPDAREGVQRLSQVLSGLVSNTRKPDFRPTGVRNLSQPFNSSSSTSGPVIARLLSSEDAQLAQESVDRLAALISLGPARSAAAAAADANGNAATVPAVHQLSPGGLEGLSEEAAEAYLASMYDILLRFRVPDALGELIALAGSALLGPVGSVAGLGPGAGGGMGPELVRHEDQLRLRSIDLQRSLDMYLRDGGPSPVMEGLLCSQKLGGHAQTLLESISKLLLGCVFDPIWRHRDLLAHPRVRDMVVSLSLSSMLPALATMTSRLKVMLGRPAALEAASHAWLMGFVARCFTGLCRCMKAIVEFENCHSLWSQLGDTFTAQLAVTQFVEQFSAAATAVHSSYMTWRPPQSPGSLPGADAVALGVPGGGTGSQRCGEAYLDLCAAVEVFLEGLFHITWHHSVRSEDAAAAGPPPPLLVRDVLVAMEPEGSGSVAELLAAAAAAAGATGGAAAAAAAAKAAAAAAAADVRPSPLSSISAFFWGGGGSAAAAAAAANAAASGGNTAAVYSNASSAAAIATSTVAAAAASAWPGIISGPATHILATEWLSHVVARIDGGEVLTAAAVGEMAPVVVEVVGSRPVRGMPLLLRPGPVDRDDLPLLLSVCLAVAAAGGSRYNASLTARSAGPPPPPSAHSAGSRRRSIEMFFGGGGGGGYRGAAGTEGEAAGAAQGWRASGGGGGVGAPGQHAERLLRLTVRGLKAMAASQDAELAPYPAIFSAHSCAVEMHKLLTRDINNIRGKGTGSRVSAGGGGLLITPATGGGARGGGSAAPNPALFWPFAPPPPKPTALLLDALQAALLSYSAFLHPDPDKDPLTLRAVERCHEQLLELCTTTGEGLRTGVAAMAYAAHSGLLPALEAVLRSAGLAGRLESLRVLLGTVFTSVPALQQLVPGRDMYLFLTLRKLIIACINLACPNPLEYPPQPPPASRRSLTLILQNCSTGGTPHAAATAGPGSGSGSITASGVPYSQQQAKNGTSRKNSMDSGAQGGAGGGSGKRPSFEAASSGGRAGGMATSESSRRNSLSISGRPLIIPLSVELLEMVVMLVGRFIEVHEAQVAAAANIRMDGMDGSGGGARYSSRFGSDDGDGDRERDRADAATSAAGRSASTQRGRLFEREAMELLPLAQLLPYSLWCLVAPASDLVDALAQEVINDNGSGSLYGELLTNGSCALTPTQRGSGLAHSQSRSHMESSSSSNLHLPPDLEVNLTQGASKGSSNLQPAKPGLNGNSSDLPGSGRSGRSSLDISQPPQKSSTLSMQRSGGIASVRHSPRGSLLGMVQHGGGGDDVRHGGEARSAAASAAAGWPATLTYGSRSAMVLSRCADTLHSLFRLTVALSDLNRRAPHPDWPALIAVLQPQQLLARAVQVLVHGLQCKQQAAADQSSASAAAARFNFNASSASSSAGGGGSRGGLAFPSLLSSLLSAAVCGVQSGWLVPESFGIPSATLDPAEQVERPPGHLVGQRRPGNNTVGAAGAAAAGGGGGVGVGGSGQSALFSRVRRFTVISANPEGRAYQWAMLGDEPAGGEEEEGEGEGGEEEESWGDVEEAEGGEGCVGLRQRQQQRRRVLLLQGTAPGGAWSALPQPPNLAVVPTRALQVLVSEYGSAADKLLFDILLRGLSNRHTTPPSATSTSTNTHSTRPGATGTTGGGATFFWVPPTVGLHPRTCSNPCCMNLSDLQEAQLRLAACPRCGSEWYCSRHCQAMHWHSAHKARCAR